MHDLPIPSVGQVLTFPALAVLGVLAALVVILGVRSLRRRGV
jgi:hypothetical protein